MWLCCSSGIFTYPDFCSVEYLGTNNVILLSPDQKLVVVAQSLSPSYVAKKKDTRVNVSSIHLSSSASVTSFLENEVHLYINARVANQ